ncbi:MAG: hypothetical protein ACUVXA_06915 [Candidatus Jordarchaeum sp.]|uniref:hypothetical protein n=1 Tax=Candidatus Jordarchaeum sp. TaxID=2823881 RepID=UPI004049BAAA
MEERVLFWLMDMQIPDLNFEFGKANFQGNLLIMSRQLWSLLKDSTVRSCLIGPGIVLGKVDVLGKPVHVEERVGIVIFDPTEMRPDEPTPLVNIISPEVFDPLESSTSKEIEKIIENISVQKGKILVPEEMAKIKHRTALPITMGREISLIKAKVRHVSGVDRARFVLGGKHRAIYGPLAKGLKEAKFHESALNKILRADTKTFQMFTRKNIESTWTIIEQYPKISAKNEAYDQFSKEYRKVLDTIYKYEDQFIY